MPPDSISTASARRSFWPSTLILVLFLISQGNQALIVGPLSPSFFEMQFTFSPTHFAEILAQWGPTGVERYRSHFVFDLIHPLLFGAFGWVSVRTSPLFSGITGVQERALRWLLPLAAGFDYVENSCQLRLLAVPLGTSDWLVPVSATAATIKWMLASVFVVCLVWRFIRWNMGPATSTGRD